MHDDSTPTLDRRLPAELAVKYQSLLGADDPPATLEEWAEAVASYFDDRGIAIGEDELCRAESSRHEARVDGEVRHFACVLDPLLLPFVLDSDPVDVRSRSPVSDAVVEMTVGRDHVAVEPDAAVVSLGVAADVAGPAGGESDAAFAYRALCPYLNAFPDRREYDEWADGTGDAVTTAVPAAEAHALARRLGPRVTR